MKLTSLFRRHVLAMLIGVCTVVAVATLFSYVTERTPGSHPIGSSTDTEVHVHSDFKLYIGDERIRFTDAKYQSTPEHTHHATLHFHDGNDEVIHRHANEVTLSDFFASLGMKLTNECLTLDTAVEHCTNETEQLFLIVNGERITNITDYIIGEEDRILVYFGDPTNPNIREYVNDITDMACMYSGTCPEKGTPPTESCGLTCEVADLAASEASGLLNTIIHWFKTE